MNCGRMSAAIASSLAAWSALSFSSVTSRSRIAAKPPPPPPAGWATASGSHDQPLVVVPDAGRPGPDAAPAGGSTPASRTRSAALGTLSTLSRWSVTSRTLAVMPGSRRPPLLEKPTTAT